MTAFEYIAALLNSLKIRIALAAALVVVAALAMLATTLMSSFESEYIKRAVSVQRDIASRTAMQTGERIEDRLDAMAALARRVPVGIHDDAERAAAMLASKPAPQRLFQTLFIATPDGVVVARAEDGQVSRVPFSIADRPYFEQMRHTRGPVMSEPIESRADGHPIVVVLQPLFGANGVLSTVVGGALALGGPSGLNDVAQSRSRHSQTIIVDAAGQVVGHDDSTMLLKEAAALPELHEFFRSHRGQLRGDDSQGAVRIDDRVIGWSSIAGSRWYVLEVTQMDELAAAIAAIQRRTIASGVLLSALGGAAIFVVCLILFWRLTHLRDRAMQVLTESVELEKGWPEGQDEIGNLSHVFQHILRERLNAEQMSRSMLVQLQAIMDNASVGIAFSRNERFELVSPSFAILTGYSRRELSGSPISNLATSDDEYAALREYIASQGGRFDLELPVRRKGGANVWVRAVGSPVTENLPDSGTIWIVEDVSEARRMREELSWSASHDPLTALLNRREFEVRVTKHLERPDRMQAAVVFMDLDRFKQVNDAGGHAAGDRMLRDLARLLETHVRQSDRVARLGGDEFALLLVGCTLEKALEIAERIRCAVRAYRLELDGRVHSVGVSIGIAAIDKDDLNLTDVLKAADAACYEAKRCGRDAVRTWHIGGAKPIEAAALFDGCAGV